MLYRYALYSIKQAADCISKGAIEGIGTSKCSVSHKNLQVGQEVKMQVGSLQHSYGRELKFEGMWVMNLKFIKHYAC